MKKQNKQGGKSKTIKTNQKTKIVSLIEKRIKHYIPTIQVFFAIILALLFALICTTPALAAPTINSVNGIVADGKTITINGSGFGVNGPNVILFDDFSRGDSGSPISLNATIGSWSGENNVYTPSYTKDIEGNVCADLIKDGVMHQLYIDFDPVQEIFISYRVAIPRGKDFPYSFAPETFPPGSQWKLSWLMDGERGYMGNDDLCIPTWGNGTYFSIGGNDNAFQYETGRPGTNTNWFSFLGWNRFSAYMKAGEIPDVDKGIAWSQGMSEEFGQKQFNIETVLFDGDDSADGYEFSDDSISQWNRFNLPGWQRSGDDNAEAMYDDVYIASGNFAASRIEIGNAPIYTNCTKLAISTPNTWSNTKITATIREGIFDVGENAYIFVVDASGNASTGYSITIGNSNSTQYRADVDNNSQINTTDAMLTLRNSLGLSMTNTNWQSSSTTGDVNCDGTTTSTDAMLILRYSLGLSMEGTGWCEE